MNQNWNGARAMAVAVAPLTALDRLRQIKENRDTFLREVHDNWTGWLFSVVLHGSVFALGFFLITSTPPAVGTDYTLDSGYNNDDTLKLTTQDLEQDISPVNSPVDTDFDGKASVISTNTKGPDFPGFQELGSPGAPDYMTMGGGLGGYGDGAGINGDHMEGLTGKPWRPYIEELKNKGLDVVFVFDSTGSMGSVILETKTRIRELMKVVQYLVKDARLGLVAYRDKKEFDLDGYEYTTKCVPLSKDVKPAEKFLRETDAFGGGDIPEAVYEGLQEAMNRMGWNQGSKKVIIIFGDAPPRPENDGLKKTYDLVAQWHKNTGGVVSCIDTGATTLGTTGGRGPMQEFQQIAAEGGGDVMMLTSEKELIKQLAIYIFGSEYKSHVEGVYKFVLNKKEDVRLIMGEEEAQPAAR